MRRTKIIEFPIFASLTNHLFGLDLSVKNFALMGMSGVMSGVMHAPLMAIFLTAELTGGYELFLPLLIVSTLSYGTIKMFEPYSIYAMRLAQRGELLTHHKDKAVLTLLKIDNVIETDFMTVNPDMSLKEMVEVISKSNRNLFPVVVWKMPQKWVNISSPSLRKFPASKMCAVKAL